MSNTTLDTSLYPQQLQQKIQLLREDFSAFALPDIEVFESPVSHFRMRAEFRMWHKGDTVNYVMFANDKAKTPYDVTDFPIGSQLLNEKMTLLRDALNCSEILRKKIYQVEFLTTQSGEAMVTLVYHKQLDDNWLATAQALSQEIGLLIIGRSRGQKVAASRDYVVETMQVAGKTWQYQQIESGFTQPNAVVCEKMLNWAVNHSRDHGGDLLELYCGNGNFTLPLSTNFNKVMATELSKPSVNSALFNIELNKVENIAIGRMSSEEFVQALDKVRAFNRLSHVNLDDYNFSTIFVDPPRAGMDPYTTSVAQRFDNIIYISCNPATLKANLETITQTHDINAFAVFDQFPYTHHLECGVILKKRKA